MDIKVIHDTVLFYLNKEQNGYVTHEEIDEVLDRAQMVLFNQYHTNPKLPAQAQANVYGESQRMDDALSPFKASYTLNAGTTPGGLITLPAGYMHLINLYTTTFNSQLGRNVYSGVQMLSEEELVERLESQVIPVTSEDPVGIMLSQNRIQLYPATTATGQVNYFTRPVKPVFAYTQTGRTITYNQAGSTQMLWKDMDINNIISTALSYFGLNFSSQEVMQFAELKNAQGQ
jgi:hypothetical protein